MDNKSQRNRGILYRMEHQALLPILTAISTFPSRPSQREDDWWWSGKDTWSKLVRLQQASELWHKALHPMRLKASMSTSVTAYELHAAENVVLRQDPKGSINAQFCSLVGIASSPEQLSQTSAAAKQQVPQGPRGQDATAPVFFFPSAWSTELSRKKPQREREKADFSS